MNLQRRRPIAARSTRLALALSLITTALVVPVSSAPAAAAADTNPAPHVVPALKTWSGGEGDVRLSPSTRIVADPQLTDVAQQLVVDLQAISGIEPDVVS